MWIYTYYKNTQGITRPSCNFFINHVNVIQIVNKVMQIHNSAANNLCNLLADQSLSFCMDLNRIKEVHHINILVKDNTPIFTKENYYISTLKNWKLDDIANILWTILLMKWHILSIVTMITTNPKPNLPMQINIHF